VIQLLRDFLTGLLDFLLPERYFSWKTVLYLSLFSWLMSLAAFWLGATSFTVTLITIFSWVFLAMGIGWGVDTSKINLFGVSISPWLSGGILCIFLFGLFSDSWFKPALAAWPMVSFLVVALPNLLDWDLTPRMPSPVIRQRLILLFFLSLLLSSWFLFYFRLQSWVKAYPSLASEDLHHSQFVYQLPTETTMLSAGVTHLTLAADFVQEELTGKPWSWTERWLLNLDGQQQAMQQQVHSQLTKSSPEDRLWSLSIRPLTNGNGYDLKLIATWSGPSASTDGYYLEKSCLLMPVNENSMAALRSSTVPRSETNSSPTDWANVVCDLDAQRHPGHPQY
jgi:hypothetical protein